MRNFIAIFFELLMYGGVIFFMSLLLYFFYQWVRRVRWRHNARRFSRFILFVALYFASVWALNEINLIDLDAFQILFMTWPLIVIGIGTRKVIAFRSNDDAAFGVLIIFFGAFFSLPYIEILLTDGESDGVIIGTIQNLLFLLFWPISLVSVLIYFRK